MDVFPPLDAFAAAYRGGTAQIVWTELAADLETPVSSVLKLADGQAMSFLLESVEGGAARGRYSVIGLKPDAVWRCNGDRAEINRAVRADPAAFVVDPRPPLQSLRAFVAESAVDIPPELPPMAAGVFGYLGYDAIRLIERIPNDNLDLLGIPDGVFIRPTIVAIFDSVDDTVSIATPAWPDSRFDAATAYAMAKERLLDVVGNFDRTLPHRRDTHGADPETTADPASNFTRGSYKDAVEQAKAYIRAGDVFQVVPSQRFALPFDLPPFALYRALRRLNPSPFLYYFDFGGFSVVGSSPEILVRLRDGTVTVRPIAGTRPRGRTVTEDEALARDLLADPKERAEHLMLLDLGRNDVAKVARTGTVRVTEAMVVERYSHVMHIVSNVEGRLADGFDAIDALMAGFPAGTVSGAPKVRAMEIIDELEPAKRGLYAGAVGYFAANGSMDTCIALRTAVIKDGIMYVQAGGGVVADSDPDAEYEETRNKAKALFRAAADARRYAPRGIRRPHGASRDG